MKSFDINYTELHTPLFLGGRNFGTKLDPLKTTGLFLSWEEEKQRLWIEYNGFVAFSTPGQAIIIPKDAVNDFGYVLKGRGPEIRVITNVTHPMKANIAATAQVADPTGVTGKRVK